MFNLQEEPINRLMETSQHLHGQLVRSPLWEMLKTEPSIMNWIKALGDVESEIKKLSEALQ